MLHKITNLIASALMFLFGIQKIIGVEEAKAAFIQFQEIIGIDADLFRVFTGATEVGIAILLIFATIKQSSKLTFFAYAMLLSTMAGALTVEFFVREQPEIPLVTFIFTI